MHTDTPVPITLTFAEANVLWNTGFPHTNDVEWLTQAGRFEYLDGQLPADEWEARILLSASYSMLWTESRLGATLIAKVHRAHDYDAHVLWDLIKEEWVIATTWDMDNHPT